MIFERRRKLPERILMDFFLKAKQKMNIKEGRGLQRVFWWISNLNLIKNEKKRRRWSPERIQLDFELESSRKLTEKEEEAYSMRRLPETNSEQIRIGFLFEIHRTWRGEGNRERGFWANPNSSLVRHQKKRRMLPPGKTCANFN